jgi:predicted nucleic acid-binding protein
VALIEAVTEQLVVPLPVLVELDQLVGSRVHSGVFVEFLSAVLTTAFSIENLEMADISRIAEICQRYSDSDIGFVDAAVLAIVERLNEPKLATLDRRHFGMPRPRHVDALILLPE